MKNYYEILEVDKNASPEVIEKVYKILVKKYHPDLQPENEKKIAEKKIKAINEAYDILSNKEKRKNYDNKLHINSVNLDIYNSVITENIKLKNELTTLKNMLNLYKYSSNINSQNSTHNFQSYNYKNDINNFQKNNNNKLNKKNILNQFISLLKNLFIFLFSILIIYFIFHITFIRNLFFNLDGFNGIISLSLIFIFIYFINKK